MGARGEHAPSVPTAAGPVAWAAVCALLRPPSDNGALEASVSVERLDAIVAREPGGPSARVRAVLVRCDAGRRRRRLRDRAQGAKAPVGGEERPADLRHVPGVPLGDPDRAVRADVEEHPRDLAGMAARDLPVFLEAPGMIVGDFDLRLWA